MDADTILTIAHKEIRDARRHRWFVLFAALFAVLSLAVSYLGLAGLGTFGVAGFGRTTASLLHLVLLIVPLLGLLIGAVSVAGERERGTLLMLMAQPVTSTEVLLGKFLGACLALSAASLVGFGVSGLVIARAAGAGALGAYLGFVGLTLLFGVVHVGLGLCLSVGTGRTNTAIGLAIVMWLIIVLFSDLGVMGTAVVLRLSPAQLLWISLGNPAQVFKLAAMQMLQGNLELLGSSGLYASSVLGAWLTPALALMLVGWITATVGVALLGFRRRGVL